MGIVSILNHNHTSHTPHMDTSRSKVGWSRDRRIDQKPFVELFFRDLIGPNNEIYCSHYETAAEEKNPSSECNRLRVLTYGLRERPSLVWEAEKVFRTNSRRFGKRSAFSTKPLPPDRRDRGLQEPHFKAIASPSGFLDLEEHGSL
jgi:hypothetical protein